MSAPFYSPAIKYFEENTKGQDYVVGDIHGRYDLVYQALEQSVFDPQCDRLFCVGDLIDRGPYSAHVLEFLSKPFVHAIRGNHEDILLSLYNGQTPSEEKIAYFGNNIGLNWWLSVPDSQRLLILEALRKLPLVAEIQTYRGTVGLLHADLDENLTWQQFKEEINNGNNHVIEEALWGRSRLSYNVASQVEGIGRIYVGHTVQDNIKKLANVIAIDTGAVFNQHLTMAQLVMHTQIITEPNPVTNGVKIFKNINEDLPLFGQYATFPVKNKI